MNQPLGRLSPPPPAAVASALKVTHLTIEWLAGDGSDRCYFRVRSPELKESLVLMQLSGSDAENLRQGRYDWVDISNLLSENNIPAPRCVAKLPEHAAIIIEDYGDLMLETVVLEFSKKSDLSGGLDLIRGSLKTIGQFLAIKPDGKSPWTTRAFDAERFVWELNFFVKKYLIPIAHYQLSPQEESEFFKDIESLSTYLASYSKYFVHRDFHSRNIMIHKDQVAIIDFQDARFGPPSYDLVSLVFDSYIPLSVNTRLDLLEQGFEIIGKTSGPAVAARAREEWKPMLLQRQLKAIGSFGYLTVDRLKGDYLKNVAPALQTLLDANVQDNRWPFLSGKMLNILAKTLPDRIHVPDGSQGFKMAPASGSTTN